MKTPARPSAVSRRRRVAFAEGLEPRLQFAAAAVTHIYELNGNGNDSLGGPALAANGGTFSSTEYAFGTAGKGLTGTNVVEKSEYSIEIRFKFLTTATSGYKKVIDFAGLTAETGVYQISSGNQFWPIVGNGPTSVPLGTVQNFVLTRDATTKTVTGYTNGVKQWSFVDNGSAAVFSQAGNLLKLFIDDTSNSDESGPGTVDRVRTYKGVLTAAEVTSLQNGGLPPGAVPEAEVRGNNVVIADNDTTPTTADATDFGTTSVGAPVSRTFTVRNVGTKALTTAGLVAPAGFTVTEGLSASIAPGASDTFTVRANATAVGTFTGNLTFNNNDSNENPYNFTIKAVVNPATFSLVGGVLTVTGTAGNDYVRGSVVNNVLTMKMNALSQTFANASAITRIVVNALGGNDLILLAQSVNRPTSLNGGDGNDTFYGGAGADVINGGNDTDSSVKGANDSLTLVEEILA